MDVWVDGDDDLSVLVLNNSLSVGVSVGVGGVHWNSFNVLGDVSAGLGVLNWLGVENLDGFLNSVAGTLGGNLVELGKVNSQVLVSEFDFSLGLDTELFTGSWLAVHDNGLGGDVGFNGSAWDQLRVLGDESTDLSLGKVEGCSLSLHGHVEGGIHRAGVGL